MRPRFDETSHPQQNEGARNAGCATHPQPRAQGEVRAHERNHHEHAEQTSGVPHAMGYGLLRALPGDPRFGCHRRFRLQGTTLLVESTEPPQAWTPTEGARTTRLGPSAATSPSAPTR